MNIKQFLQNSVLPKNEARLLLQHITQLTHAQLLTHDEQILSPKQLATLQELETRRAAGEPMAYLLGYREFYGRRFRTTPATLIPRPETEHLVEAVLSKMPSAARVWDLGTGSGAIAITLACERADAQIFASDISENALAVAQQNAADLGAKVSFHRGSWFDVQAKIAADASFDIIVSNPPYIAADDEHLQQGDLRFEPANALSDFADGLSHYRHLAEHAAAYLKAGGWLMLEHGYQQAIDVQNILRAAGWQNVASERDLAGWERLIVAQKA